MGRWRDQERWRTAYNGLGDDVSPADFNPVVRDERMRPMGYCDEHYERKSDRPK